MRHTYRSITQAELDAALCKQEEKKAHGESELDVLEFQHCNLKGIDFSNRNLSNAIFVSVLVDSNTSFIGTNLTFAAFSWSDLRQANFNGANLTNCRFFECSVAGKQFVNAKCDGSHFSKTDIRDFCPAEMHSSPVKDAMKCIIDNFLQVEEGVIGYIYKIGNVSKFLSNNQTSKGAVLTCPFVHNPTSCDECQGFEIHSFCDEMFDLPAWEVLIRWHWLAGIMPDTTDPSGNTLICERCEVVRKIK